MARAKSTFSKSKDKFNAPVSSLRYKIVGLLFCVVFVLLVGRAAYLQIIDTERLQARGAEYYLREQKQLPTRGMIVDRNSRPLAVSTPVDSLWMHPPTVLSNVDKTRYPQLASLLGMSEQELLDKAKKAQKRQFVYLQRQAPPPLAHNVLDLAVPGVNSVREYKRSYPAGAVTGHVLGFTSIDNSGQEGLERSYDSVLKGQPGRIQIMKDRAGHVVEYVEQLSQVRHGETVQLSLDSRIQYLAYRQLQAAVKKHQASSASLVALDVQTGEILAMVSAPDFNPNERSRLTSQQFRNRSIMDDFEPGSTVKPFVVAMAMDEQMISPQTMIDTGHTHYRIGRQQVKDTQHYGVISVTDIIKKSSNIGVAKIALKLPAAKLYETYKLLGFGKTSGIKLPGEEHGILRQRESWPAFEHATLSYGYAMSVTALQLARSYQALANGGVLMPASLHLVSELPKGKRVFTQKTAKQVTLMLESATSLKGTAPKAQVDQYRVAGKTGTVHRFEDGQYLDDSYLSLFAGFAPVSDPQIVIVVVINDPKAGEHYGGQVAAPVFSNVMNGALRYRDVVPDAIEQNAQPDTAPRQASALAQGGRNG